jgi:hypothetical protein
MVTIQTEPTKKEKIPPNQNIHLDIVGMKYVFPSSVTLKTNNAKGFAF